MNRTHNTEQKWAFINALSIQHGYINNRIQYAHFIHAISEPLMSPGKTHMFSFILLQYRFGSRISLCFSFY